MELIKLVEKIKDIAGDKATVIIYGRLTSGGEFEGGEVNIILGDPETAIGFQGGKSNG